MDFRPVSGAAPQGPDEFVYRAYRVGRRPARGTCAVAGRQRDGCLHDVLVHPDYHGRGIAGKMMEMVKERYRGYLYIEITPEESRNAAFSEKHGFQVMEEGIAMQLCNFSNRR